MGLLDSFSFLTWTVSSVSGVGLVVCVAPGCSGKRDLGFDAGRAVEFLTEPALPSLAAK